MAVTTITFEPSPEVLSELDHAAAVQHRDRSAIVQDALERYFAYDREFRAMVQEGIRQADAGELVDHSEIESKVAEWTRQASLKQ